MTLNFTDEGKAKKILEHFFPRYREDRRCSERVVVLAFSRRLVLLPWVTRLATRVMEAAYEILLFLIRCSSKWGIDDIPWNA